jgi:trehalose-6-phosphate synthase
LQLAAALIVNPFDVEGVAAALDQALAMPLAERRQRHGVLLAQLETHDVHAWCQSFLDALDTPAALPSRQPERELALCP